MKFENDPLAAFWMPFTANRAYKAQPRQLASAKDMHYVSDQGARILDGTAGLWCVNAGHCRTHITEAIRKTAGELDFAPVFQLGHPLACDALYGDGKPLFLSAFKSKFKLSKDVLEEKPLLSRLALHAFQLQIEDISGATILLEAPLHKDLRATLQQLEKRK